MRSGRGVDTDWGSHSLDAGVDESEQQCAKVHHETWRFCEGSHC
jgi:hypothetical protein